MLTVTKLESAECKVMDGVEGLNIKSNMSVIQLKLVYRDGGGVEGGDRTRNELLVMEADQMHVLINGRLIY